MGTTHIVIIALGGLLALCVGLLLRAWWLLRRKNRALSHSIGTEKGHILKEIALEKEKKALEERLKALLAEGARKKGAKTVSTKLETGPKPLKQVSNNLESTSKPVKTVSNTLESTPKAVKTVSNKLESTSKALKTVSNNIDKYTDEINKQL
jgi:septal ring factor EnvC (AmiA/AmiB activator)